MKSTLSVLVMNKPGVLTRISGLLSRRVFNIESIAAGLTEQADITRITIVVNDDDDNSSLEQVIKQLSKQIDVIKVQRLESRSSIERELALIKVSASPETRSDIVDIVNIFRAGIVDVNNETMIIELTGDENKINALCTLLEQHGIVEMVRTGKVALSRSPLPVQKLTDY